jgi:glycosyltransferase involved in cell wall biosynthesis
MLSVVIPVYNEENAIHGTIQEIRDVFTQMAMTDYEIIAVDDGSTDQTAEKLKACGVVTIHHPQNAGYGRSLKDGILAARHDVIVITDADLTYPFHEVPKLLQEFEKGFDMVVGARTGAHYRGSALKSPMRKILKFLVEFTVSHKVDDVNSGLRIFRKSTITPFLPHLCDTFSFTTSLTLAYMMTGKFVKFLPIRYEKREGTSKVKLLKDSLRTLQYILQAINYYNPLKAFLLFFCMCIFFSGLGFLGSALFGLKSGFLLGVGGLLVALVILSLGLVADLLKQIMNKH